MTKAEDLLEYEKEALSNGKVLIAGIDEAGRGPLAGPVVAACAIMPLDNLIQGVNDSKKVSEKRREEIFEIIKEKAIAYSIVEASPEEIEEFNILGATKRAMQKCVESLNVKPDIVFIDAVKLDIPYDIKAIIKGDAKSYNIAAASILAKVHRDRLMREYAKIYPQYGFEKHKGYGTAEHIKALKEFGATPIHRPTFIKHFSSTDGNEE